MGHRAVVCLWLVALVLAAVLFTLAPGIDLAVSGLFFRPGQGFWLAENPVVEGARQILWTATKAAVLVAAVAAVAGLALRRPVIGLPGVLWAQILAIYLIGPGLVANVLLKEHWGRARPATVAEFGGDRQFTAALDATDQCARNCSFVSGEGAAAAALGIALYLVLRHLRPRMPAGQWRAGLAMALILPVLGGALRLVAGRHFLSDVVFAMLVVAGVAVALDLLAGRWRNQSAVPDPVLTTPATPPIRRDT